MKNRNYIELRKYVVGIKDNPIAQEFFELWLKEVKKCEVQEISKDDLVPEFYDYFMENLSAQLRLSPQGFFEYRED